MADPPVYDKRLVTIRCPGKRQREAQHGLGRRAQRFRIERVEQ
jgi:hypothetical protein